MEEKNFFILITFLVIVLYLVMLNNINAESNDSVLIDQTEYESFIANFFDIQ